MKETIPVEYPQPVMTIQEIAMTKAAVLFYRGKIKEAFQLLYVAGISFEAAIEVANLQHA